MHYPNGLITIRKLEEMIDKPNDWKVFAKSKITKDEIQLYDRTDLSDYAFRNDYTIGYEFIGNWDEYKDSITKKDSTLFKWSRGNIEIRVVRKDGKISAELVKWQNNKPTSTDMPTCFVIAYWYNKDLRFVDNRFLAEIPKILLPIVLIKMNKVQNLLNNLKEEE